jgi:hypothetical protein
MNLAGFGWEWGSCYELDQNIGQSISSSYGYINNGSSGQGQIKSIFFIPERSEIYTQIYFKNKFSYEENRDWQGYLIRTAYLNDTLASVIYNKDNSVSLYIGDKETLLYRSASLYDNRWHVFELRNKVDSVNGNLSLRVDGEILYSYDGDTIPTASPSVSAIDRVVFGIVWDYFSYSYSDNFVINDTFGDTNNSWPNGTRMRLLLPSAAGSSSQWSRSTGATNYSLVDELNPLGSSDYVYVNTDGLTDLYAMANLDAEANKILWIRGDYWLSGQSLTVKNFTPVVKISGVEYYDDIKPIPYSINLERCIWEVSPATSAEWTLDEINNIEFGMRSES